MVKCILVASPGFVKVGVVGRCGYLYRALVSAITIYTCPPPQDQFYEYMYAEAAKHDIKVLFENKPKFLLIHSSSGHKHALKEVLADPAVAARLADTKV